jgi:hypothetical protein
LRVSINRVTPPVSALAPGRSSSSRRTAGSGTRRNSGIENTTHQTATLASARRVPVPASGMPNSSGFWIINRLIASSIPPPRYPMA